MTARIIDLAKHAKSLLASRLADLLPWNWQPAVTAAAA